MSVSNQMPWDCVLTAMEEDILAATDADIVAEAAGGEARAVRDLVSSRLVQTRSIAPRRRSVSRLPADPAERRALLRLMLARPAARRLAVGFSEARDLADKDVEKLLRLLIASDQTEDPA